MDNTAIDGNGSPVYRETLVPNAQAGARADVALAALWPEFSRARIQRWIRDGHVEVDGRTLRPRDPVAAGAKVVLDAPAQAAVDDRPEAIPLQVVYEDADLMVINKPAGMVVHPGAGNRAGTLVNALLSHHPSSVSLPRAGLVHRLDKETSGLLVVGCSQRAHTRLTEMMQARDIRREYLALVCGVPVAGGPVDEPIARHPGDRKRMAVRAGGREAVTHFTVLERYRAHALLTVQLETGRTHQIRVHLAHRRFPIVGDPVYGRRMVLPKSPTPGLVTLLQGFRRQALHATRLSFAHPVDGTPLSFEAPLPEDLHLLLEALRADATT
jgi:23S rRNA pseudouridine1911/1915/1917 synthase